MTVKGFLSGLTSIIQGRLASVRQAAEADAALVADAYTNAFNDALAARFAQTQPKLIGSDEVRRAKKSK